MARVILTTVLIVLLNVLVGCHPVDSGRSQLVPVGGRVLPGTAQVKAAKTGEADIVEQLTVDRQAYRQGLMLLATHYARTGNNMKLMWAKRELTALDTVPQYNYIIEAGLAGPDLKASDMILEADELYEEALRLDEKAKQLLIVRDEDLLRLALAKYNKLISKYPSSDKIDDAAFKAGMICEYFQDYTIALLYYRRAYQWDPQTIQPTRFKAAFILDRHLHRRSEALGLYQQSVETESLPEHYRLFAEKRIALFTQSGEGDE